MIEIVLDSHEGNNFYGKERPVFIINDQASFNRSSYNELARDLVSRFAQESVVIVRSQAKSFSFNDFALALFIASCQIDNNIDCAVLKVADAKSATEAYKPYVALTIAIKYVMRLGREDIQSIYKDISTLGYLGIDVKRDYSNNKFYLSLAGKGDCDIVKADNLTDILAAVGTAKALSLLQIDRPFKAEFTINQNMGSFAEDIAIDKVISNIKPLLK